MDQHTRIFNISAAQPFVDVLAEHVLTEHGADPLTLSRVWILLPSRRACLSLRTAFLRAMGGRPMLLPRMFPLGDMDEAAMALGALGETASRDLLELPPAIADSRRLLLLAQLVMQLHRQEERQYASFGQAARLAKELIRFQDEVERAQLSSASLADIVPADLAEHWQVTLEFLRLLFAQWPAVLKEERALNPVERRNRMMQILARAWKEQPPDFPVIAAGSTGSIPATAELLNVIARLPRGKVILPGLDRQISDAEPGPEHYQYGLKELLTHLQCELADVQALKRKEAEDEKAGRFGFLRAALLPAEETHQWPGLKFDRKEIMKGWHFLSCATIEEEAKYIALRLRETLEMPGKTAALVTPDRALARRVAVHLRRFGVVVDDSAGRPLMQMPAGVFFRALTEVAAEDASAAALLALLKHPLARTGCEAVEVREAAREAELVLLRGVRLQDAELVAHIACHPDLSGNARQVWKNVRQAMHEFAQLCKNETVSFAALLRAHVGAMEELARLPGESEAYNLWNSPDGNALLAAIEEWMETQDALEEFSPRAYQELIDILLEGRVFRPAYGTHPRLHILSPIEARLQHYDRILLGGLNEGTWPPEPSADPWMSRPMRARFGLPAPERGVGQSAHDFFMLCGAPEVFLTRAEKVEGRPAIPSRWLLRMDALLRANEYSLEKWQQEEKVWAGWAVALDQPEKVTSMLPPKALPPVDARPRKLSATQIEKLAKDPYRIYAEKVLGLKPLDPLDQEPDPRIYGTLLHRTMELFVAAYPDKLPDEALQKLIECGRTAFSRYKDRPAVAAYWWPRFIGAAKWVIAREKEKRASGILVLGECRGQMKLSLPGGEFLLSAKMDRVEVGEEGVTIVDYKTGEPPSGTKVRSGENPQLPVETMIVQSGEVEGVRRSLKVTGLEYWKLAGSEAKCERKIITATAEETGALLEAVGQGVRDLLQAFDDPAHPYVVKPAFDREAEYNDYEHLERVKEWA